MGFRIPSLAKEGILTCTSNCTHSLAPSGARDYLFSFPRGHARGYSHSIVAGGFDVMSYTTRLIPFTSFTMRFDITFNTS